MQGMRIFCGKRLKWDDGVMLLEDELEMVSEVDASYEGIHPSIERLG